MIEGGWVGEVGASGCGEMGCRMFIWLGVRD